MPMTKWIAAALVAGTAALAAAACNDPAVPAAPTPVAPAKTESFTGTVLVTGVNTVPVVVSQPGGLTVTLTSVTPNAQLRLTIGTLNNGACSVLQSTITGPGDTPQLTGTATITGTFCLQVSDPGTLTQAVTFTVVVRHS